MPGTGAEDEEAAEEAGRAGGNLACCRFTSGGGTAGAFFTGGFASAGGTAGAFFTGGAVVLA